MTMMQRLKEETAAEHARIEQSLNLFERVRSLSDYIELLERHLSLFHSIESELHQTLGWREMGFDYAPRLKTPAIQKDLQVLGGDTNPKTMPVFHLNKFTEALGCAYVLEGSTLGGQYICRRFAKQFPLNPESGLAFYYGYGDQTGPMWKTFGTAVNNFAEKLTPFERDEVVHSAIATFRLFEEHFQTTDVQ